MRTAHIIGMALSALALGAWCGWASGFHRTTTAAYTTWALSLAAVVVLDLQFWRGKRRRPLSLRLVPARETWPRPGCEGRDGLKAIWPWLSLTLVVLVWEVLGIDTGTRQPHLTISALTQAFRPLNAAMLMVWMLVGIGYGAARARTPLGYPRASDKRSGPEGNQVRGYVALAHLPTVSPALLLPASRAIGVCFWSGVVVVGFLVDFAARRSGGRLANAEQLVRYLSAPMAVNVVLVAAWIFAGYHLFAR